MSTTYADNYYEFYFKLAYTCETRYFLVDPNISITTFISSIKVLILEHIDISPNEDIEIVEAGHPNNINGRDAELAPALEPSDFTISQLYQYKYKYTAFYIRKIPCVLPVEELLD